MRTTGFELHVISSTLKLLPCKTDCDLPTAARIKLVHQLLFITDSVGMKCLFTAGHLLHSHPVAYNIIIILCKASESR